METRERRLTIVGRLEPVSIALSTLRTVTVLETTEAHVLFALADPAAAGLARPRRRSGRSAPEVEILVTARADRDVAALLSDLLRTTLDCPIVADDPMLLRRR